MQPRLTGRRLVVFAEHLYEDSNSGIPFCGSVRKARES